MVMFQMSPGYAAMALVLMVVIYRALRYSRKGERDLGAIMEGVMFQLTRRLQITLQQGRAGSKSRDWRPSVIAVTRHSMDRVAHFDLLRWLCHRHGFGQFIQYIEGKLSIDSEVYSRVVGERLIRRSEASHAGVFVDSIIAPSFRTALAQAVQMPGISGLPNNTVLLEFSKNHPEEIEELIDGAMIVTPLGFNVAILRSSEVRFGYRTKIHIWLTEDDFVNAPFMILVAYIILGHPEWHNAEISIFACYPKDRMEEEYRKLNEMVVEGRLPIAPQNLTAVPFDDDTGFERNVARLSTEADLVIVGYRYADLEQDARSLLTSLPELNEVLFVSANELISIS
jgi:hypothetical protein